MNWKRIALASLLGMIVMSVAYIPLRAVLISWYLHTAPNDGQSAIGVWVGSLYLALACGLLTFTAVLFGGRQRR